jgi:2-polyprenyl-3-methyl-5-hydroxy-6-metoxy-1,4-benzoquinol methylase
MSRRELPPYPVGEGVPGDIVSAREGYNRWSAVYDGDANPLIALEEPQVERMLGDVYGLRIVDVGTGTGRHSVRLANAGANVTALDFSRGMLSQARAKSGADRV